MGVIKREGIQQSLVAYIGVLIGMVNVLFIYPKMLSTEQIGVIRFLTSSSLLIAPFIFLGGNNLTIRFFPNFRDDKNGHNGFLFIILSLLTLGFLLFTVIALVFQDTFYSWYESELIRQFLPYIIPMTFFVAYGNLFSTYAINFKRITVPSVFNDLLVKVIQPVLVILFFYELLSFTGVINGVLIMYGFILVGLVAYIAWLRQLHLRPNFGYLKRPLLKEMLVYAGYGVLGSVGNKIATRIDEVMITTLLGEGFTGIFFISAVIGNVVDIPRRALSKISSPVIAESIKNEDWANVQKLYQKTALNQFLVGLFILLGIWLSVDDIFSLMPNGDTFLMGKQVILILGITNIVNMATGVNEEIIGYSRYFRYKFYFILCLALFNVVMNFIFIRLYGINGAALATLSSITLYNVLKFGLIQIKFKMHPFSIQMLYVLVLALLSYGLITLLPMPASTLLAMVIKSAAFTLIFGLSVLYFRVSPDINVLVADVWQRVLKGLR